MRNLIWEPLTKTFCEITFDFWIKAFHAHTSLGMLQTHQIAASLCLDALPLCLSSQCSFCSSFCSSFGTSPANSCSVTLVGIGLNPVCLGSFQTQGGTQFIFALRVSCTTVDTPTIAFFLQQRCDFGSRFKPLKSCREDCHLRPEPMKCHPITLSSGAFCASLVATKGEQVAEILHFSRNSQC